MKYIEATPELFKTLINWHIAFKYLVELFFFLNSIIFQDTISILHNATTAGIVPVVQELMSSERLALSRDQYGATPLHKAVLFYQPKLVKLISEKFPLTTKAKDQEGRTPLHYAAALHDSGIFYRYLLKCGADELIQDKVLSQNKYLRTNYFYSQYAKTAKHYVYAPQDIDLNMQQVVSYILGF